MNEKENQYYRFNDNKIDTTKELTPTVIVDIDEDGAVIGIEILEPNKNEIIS